MKKILKSWLLFAALCTCATAVAERPILIHSHNDYCRRAPYWQAYAQQPYDKLAAGLRASLDMKRIYRILNGEE